MKKSFLILHVVILSAAFISCFQDIAVNTAKGAFIENEMILINKKSVETGFDTNGIVELAMVEAEGEIGFCKDTSILNEYRGSTETVLA